MEYKFTQNDNYSDFASGKVLYSIPGASAFPIRLISEIFQFCYEYLGKKDQVTIFDPCCGSAYHLTALGFLHPDKIKKIICSDINKDILISASKNLGLLTDSGINNRISELNEMYKKFNKESHKAALESAIKLKAAILDKNIVSLYYKDDMLSDSAFSKLNNEGIDIIFADIPYSNLETWQGDNAGEDEEWIMLENMLRIADPNTLIVIASTKKQEVKHEEFTRIKKLIIGKRKITILRMK